MSSTSATGAVGPDSPAHNQGERVADPTFTDRMFLASEAVYASIERGEHPDVPAALIEAQVNASTEETTNG